MAVQTDDPRLTAEGLKAEIAKQQATVEALRAAGHICSDAERQLQRLKDSFAKLD